MHSQQYVDSCSFSRNLIQSFPTIQHPDAIYTSRPISALISAANSSRKRKSEESNLETNDNDGKHAIYTVIYSIHYITLFSLLIL